MMTMPPRLRKGALTAHVACSVGSLGAVAAFLVLAVTAMRTGDEGLARAAYPAMDVIARLVVLPLVLASLVTGVVQALGTPWGLFRHYWVLTKLLLTLLVAGVLLLQLELVSHLARGAASGSLSLGELRALGTSPALHAAGGLVVLLLPVVLSLYKPRGLTRHGWRKQHQQVA
ncbi:MAG TPA: hypothetical protein VF699_12165 [Caulobacteraceae bacterium]|jgi:hypothetical protein